MSEPSQALAGLERLRSLSDIAAASKGKFTPEARREAVDLLGRLWADASILPAQILDAAERMRGSDIAASIEPIWSGLPQQRRQAIAKSMVERPIESTGRNIYASAAIVQSDPELAVDLLLTARDNRETADRLHVAFFKHNPELPRAFARSQTPQHRIRRVLLLFSSALLLNSYKPGSPADRAVLETLVDYVGRNGLSRDSTFGELLDRARDRIAQWPVEYRRDFALQIGKIDQETKRRCFPDQVIPGVAPQPQTPASLRPAAPEAGLSPAAGRLLPSSPVSILRDRAAAAKQESAKLRMQSEQAAALADLLDSVAQGMESVESDRRTFEQGRRDLEESQKKLFETQNALANVKAEAKTLLEENVQLRAGLEASKNTESAQASRSAELAQRCQELELALNEQRAKSLDQMQKYGQARLAEFRIELARALHSSIHDLPQTLSGLAPDLAGVVAIRLEQVIRELERQEIPLRTWGKAQE